MGEEISYYEEYAQLAIRQYAAKDAAGRGFLVDAVGDLKIGRVLDIGCGAGQELLPFVEKKGAYAVGIDIGAELGRIGRATADNFECRDKMSFSRAKGEQLPFANESFDLVLCRIALPYMHNRRTLAEVARVLKKGGKFILKTHAPMFFVALLRDRLKTLNPKQVAYPLICLFNGTVHNLTGRQFEGGFWEGKQVFQTRAFLEREFSKHGMRIEGTLPDDNIQSPSFLIVKN
jgi:ubiquinone/menaquinone biosynthesis C-methylase UbiE